ncbi:MAG: DUF1573 domain-containing protein [Sphingobacteriales bacterium]|jgi:hypothetical protein|nr:DUF1573 domain-containing protein [Sphingobacteriales bacterium]
MKKVLVIISVLTFVACGNKDSKQVSMEVPLTADGKVDTTKLPKFEFTQDAYDFGSIKQGEKISYAFIFKNTGSTPLIISSASASCGCTVPSYPEDPIQPGAESKIDVVFDSNGKMGMQTKTITLVANTIPNTKVLYLRGEVTE